MIPDLAVLKYQPGDGVFDFAYNQNLQVPLAKLFRAVGGQPNVARGTNINVPSNWQGTVQQALMTIDTLGFDLALQFRLRRTSGQAMTIEVKVDDAVRFTTSFRYPSNTLIETLVLDNITAGEHNIALRLTGGRSPLLVDQIAVRELWGVAS